MARCRKYMVMIALIFLFATTVRGKEEDDDDNGQKPGKPSTVTFDGRSLFINDKRELIFSGSIHYPRAPVAVCMSFL